MANPWRSLGRILESSKLDGRDGLNVRFHLLFVESLDAGRSMGTVTSGLAQVQDPLGLRTIIGALTSSSMLTAVQERGEV